jgi:hypothetical protein
MSYRHTLEAALESIHEVEDLIKGFPDNGKIPPVEIDLALQKLRNLYELMLLIRGIETAPPPVTKETRSKPEPEDQQQVILEKTEKETETIISFSEEKDTGSVGEIIVEKISEKKEELIKKLKVEKNRPTLADQFKERTTLLESLNQSLTKDPENSMHIKPVSDLMSAIAINDRFTFIRELFNNDKAAFENAVTVLNSSANFNEAYNFMMQEFDWDMDSQAVQLLLDIIRRKYIKGRHE